MAINRDIKIISLLAVLVLASAGAFAKGYVVKALSPKPDWMRSAVIYQCVLRGVNSSSFHELQTNLPYLRNLGIDIIRITPARSDGETSRPIFDDEEPGGYVATNLDLWSVSDLKNLANTAHNLGLKVILDYSTRGDDNQDLAESLEHWLRETDIDGFKCDASDEFSSLYWEELRKRLQAVKPILFLAENAQPEMMNKAFDADMVWKIKDIFNAIANTKGVNTYAKNHNLSLPEMTSKDIPTFIETLRGEYPAGSVHLNMIANPESRFWEGTEFDRFGPATALFSALSYILPGIPTLCDGQEIDFNKKFELFKSDNVLSNSISVDFSAFYETLNALKHGNRALDTNQPPYTTNFIESTDPDILTFTRQSGTHKVAIIANLSGRYAHVHFLRREPYLVGLTELFSGKPAKLPENLAPWQFFIYTSPYSQ